MLGPGARNVIARIARFIAVEICRSAIINVPGADIRSRVSKKIINRKMELESEKITESPFLSCK